MAKNLVFKLGEEDFSSTIVKIDREKLYGRIVKKVIDDDGEECYAGHISADGLHIFGKTSFDSGYLNQDGLWLERKSLKILNQQDQVCPELPSSFDHPIELNNTLATEDYLMMNSKSVYHLLDAPVKLVSAVRDQDGFFQFPFNYRPHHHPDTAVLISNDLGLFMVVCESGQQFEYIGQEHFLPMDDDEDDSDEFDFAMM